MLSSLSGLSGLAALMGGEVDLVGMFDLPGGDPSAASAMSNYGGVVGGRIVLAADKVLRGLYCWCDPFTQDHPAGLWRTTDGQLLAQGTILAASAPDAKGFKRVTFAGVALPAGMYDVGMLMQGSGDRFREYYAGSHQTLAGYMIASGLYSGGSGVLIRPTNAAGSAGQMYGYVGILTE